MEIGHLQNWMEVRWHLDLTGTTSVGDLVSNGGVSYSLLLRPPKWGYGSPVDSSGLKFLKADQPKKGQSNEDTRMKTTGISHQPTRNWLI